MIFVRDLIQEYPFKTTPNTGLTPIRHLGISNDAYGGNIYPYAAKLKNGMYIIVDMSLDTIDIALDPENLTGIDMSILKKVAKQNEIIFDWQKTTKDELISLLKAKYTI